MPATESATCFPSLFTCKGASLERRKSNCHSSSLDLLCPNTHDLYLIVENPLLRHWLMYVYVQGRRLPRRSAESGSRKTPRLEDAHDLISKSMALCDGAQRNLEGFEHALPRALDHPATTEHRPLTARANVSVRVHPLGDCSVALPRQRPWTGMRPRSTQSRGSHGANVVGRLHEGKADEVKPILGPEDLVKSLEERERTLVKRTEHLEHKIQWLDEQLSQERSERRQLDQKLKRLESLTCSNDVPAQTKSPVLRRRYHFAVASDGLSSTLASHLSSCSQEMRYFEVLVDQESQTTATTAQHRGAERTMRYRRFAYSDRPYEIFAGENDEMRFAAADGVRSATKFLDSEQVSTWLDQTMPRSAADAVPLFILAKDLLRRLVSGEVNWDRSRTKQLESKVTRLEEDLGDARKTIKDYEALKRHEMQLQQEAMEKELSNAKADFQAKFRVCVQKLTPLALKNGMLQSRVKGYKQRWREALTETPAQAILRWNTEIRIEALKTLLEMDKVSFFLDDDFACTLKFSEASMMRWCKLFLHHFEVKYSGTATLLQTVCDIFGSNKATLARKVVSWYNCAESRLDDEAIGALSADAVEESPNSEILLMRNDLLEGNRDIWDIAAQLLQVPKANAMADLLGFHLEDEEMILQQWPSFLAYFYRQQTCERLLAPYPPHVTVSWARLREDCSLWPEVEKRAAIAQHGLFDVETVPPERPMDLAEVSAFIVEVFTRRAREDDIGLIAADLPQYVRHTMVKIQEPRSNVHKMSARLQTAVRAYQQGNTRVRVFARLAGMTATPLSDFYPCAERFVMTFWRELVEADTEGALSLRDLSKWLISAAGETPSAGEEQRADKESARGEGGSKTEAMIGGDRAVQTSQVASALLAAAQEHLIIPPATADTFGELPSFADVCTLLEPAHVACQRGGSLPLKDLHKLSRHSHATDSDEQVSSPATTCVSFDLATGLALDAWYRLLRQYKEHISDLWHAHGQTWDNGSNLSSPDLSQLRLFLAQACNLAFEEGHLVQLYLDMTSHDDTIEVADAVDCIARSLHRARALKIK